MLDASDELRVAGNGRWPGRSGQAALALLLLVLAPAPARSQESLVDRVAAVVGDTVLLVSEIQAEVTRMEEAGQELPSDPAARDALFRKLVETRVNDLVLIAAARQQGVEPDEQEVQALVEQDMAEVRSRFGSETEFRDALLASGLTPGEYERELAGRYRNQMLARAVIQERAGSVATPTVSDAEVREFFELRRGSLDPRPATFSLEQVIVAPEPSAGARQEALAEAEGIVEQLGDGADFEVLARRFSDDPGSAEQGGDLGWFRRGQMVPEFERMAFALPRGQVSPVVESDFGFHVIRVDRTRGGERRARHILIRPEITSQDRERARERADSVAEAVRGGASVEELAERYDTPESQVELNDIPVDQLPPAYNQALAGAGEGEVVGPFRVEGGPAGESYAIVRLLGRRAGGELTLDDVREQIRAQLEEQKMVEQIVEELREEVYVSVKI